MPPTTPAVTVETENNPSSGQILADGSGFTLYTLTNGGNPGPVHGDVRHLLATPRASQRRHGRADGRPRGDRAGSHEQRQRYAGDGRRPAALHLL